MTKPEQQKIWGFDVTNQDSETFGMPKCDNNISWIIKFDKWVTLVEWVVLVKSLINGVEWTKLDE